MTSQTGRTVELPEWADDWAEGECECGQRLVKVDCYCGGHIACARTAEEPCKRFETAATAISWLTDGQQSAPRGCNAYE